MKKLEQKVIVLNNKDNKPVRTIDDLYILKNGKPFMISSKPVKAIELFIKGAYLDTNNIIGYTPLMFVELDKQKQAFVDKNGNEYYFSDSDKNFFFVKEIRNKWIQMNDKNLTPEVAEVFTEIFSEIQYPQFTELEEKGYECFKNKDYRFFYHPEEEKYLFLLKDGNPVNLDIEEVYNNEDACKYNIANMSKSFIFDKNKKELLIK